MGTKMTYAARAELTTVVRRRYCCAAGRNASGSGAGVSHSQGQRLTALIEVLMSLRSQGYPSRRASQSDTPSFDGRRLTVEIGIPNERVARLMLSNWTTLTNIRMSSRSAMGDHFAVFGNQIP